ncbi:hypothetical protein NDU88_004693 [Pleurodeles waltl]|uniref:Uncharacterized protein n=1 Tax=Pleurodeles waltl TaxID=8319 RepID=A0AAV7PDU1_PLEWA|nr:hypothetical protein NDU88_004693 [Pleurodeles waltl]
MQPPVGPLLGWDNPLFLPRDSTSSTGADGRHGHPTRLLCLLSLITVDQHTPGTHLPLLAPLLRRAALRPSLGARQPLVLVMWRRQRRPLASSTPPFGPREAPAHTDPRIRRTALSAVLLSHSSLMTHPRLPPASCLRLRPNAADAGYRPPGAHESSAPLCPDNTRNSSGGRLRLNGGFLWGIIS